MRQFIGGIRDSTNIYELLLSVAPPPIREAATAVQAAESVLMECDDEPAQLRYANALAAWGDVGGYEAETSRTLARSPHSAIPMRNASGAW